MSLLESLKAPFTKLLPLATIVFVGVLFAVYRLSGGGLSIEPQKPVAVKRAVEAAPVKQQPPATAAREQELDDFMKQVLAKRKGEKAAPKAAAVPKAPTPRDELADIEAHLGLK